MAEEQDEFWTEQYNFKAEWGMLSKYQVLNEKKHLYTDRFGVGVAAELKLAFGGRAIGVRSRIRPIREFGTEFGTGGFVYANSGPVTNQELNSGPPPAGRRSTYCSRTCCV